VGRARGGRRRLRRSRSRRSRRRKRQHVQQNGRMKEYKKMINSGP